MAYRTRGCFNGQLKQNSPDSSSYSFYLGTAFFYQFFRYAKLHQAVGRNGLNNRNLYIAIAGFLIASCFLIDFLYIFTNIEQNAPYKMHIGVGEFFLMLLKNFFSIRIIFFIVHIATSVLAVVCFFSFWSGSPRLGLNVYGPGEWKSAQLSFWGGLTVGMVSIVLWLITLVLTYKPLIEQLIALGP